MLKEITNKKMKSEKTKEVSDFINLDLILVNLQNNTYINGKVLPKGENYVTHEEFNQLKRFL